MNTEMESMTGEVKGSRFATSALSFSSGKESDLEKDKMRIVWENGNAWRLRMLARGNDPWALPGQERLFGRQLLKRAVADGHAVIVVSGPHTSLTSFYHWSTFHLGKKGVIPIDLRKAEFQGGDVQEKIEIIASDILRGAPSLKEDSAHVSEPTELMTRIAKLDDEHRPDAVVFRGFEALDPETATRFYGGLRSLLEDSRRPLRSLGILLLGQSVEALNPLDGAEISKFVSLSEVYTMSGLNEGEIKNMYDVARRKSEIPELSGEDFKILHSWVGGEPLLVHAIFQLLYDDGGARRCQNVSEAIDFLEKERLPAFEIWTQSLTSQLKKQSAIAEIVEQLLRQDQYSRETSGSRIPLTTLFVNNWIRSKDGVWRWRSHCRRLLANEAYTEFYFG